MNEQEEREARVAVIKYMERAIEKTEQLVAELKEILKDTSNCYHWRLIEPRLNFEQISCGAIESEIKLALKVAKKNCPPSTPPTACQGGNLTKDKERKDERRGKNVLQHLW